MLHVLKKPTTFRQRVKSTLPDFVLGALLGIFIFWLIYGFSTLNVQYDSWIFNGYIEKDIIQSYAGWMYLRHADWSMPFTVANNISVPLGMSVSFTDSIPLLTVILKIFAPFMPETFQYFGWYNLFNFAMMGGFSVLLVRGFKFGKIYSFIASILFLCAPIFIERTFRHSALASQWLIIAVLWLYFKSRREEYFPFIGFTVLCTLAVGIHFYFVPMMYAVFFAALVYQVMQKKKILRYILYLGMSFVPVLGMSYILGILTRGGDGSAGGFGSYSFNLNAVVNPTSFDWFAESGRLEWSTFLPVLPQYKQQYDAFNYAGAGILLGVLVILVYTIVRLIVDLKNKRKDKLAWGVTFVKSHAGLLFVCVCLSLYALSNIVTINQTTLFKVPLPDIILIFCGIFRSSGRLFWVCNYLITLSVVVFVGRVLRLRMREIVITIIVLVQLADISGVLIQKHAYFANGVIADESVYANEGWQFMATSYNNFYYLENLFYYDLVAAPIRYNPLVQTNALLANRGNFDAVKQNYEVYLQQVKSGEPLPEDTVYICENDDMIASIIPVLNEGVGVYQIGDFYLIAMEKAGNPIENMA